MRTATSPGSRVFHVIAHHNGATLRQPARTRSTPQRRAGRVLLPDWFCICFSDPAFVRHLPIHSHSLVARGTVISLYPDTDFAGWVPDVRLRCSATSAPGSWYHTRMGTGDSYNQRSSCFFDPQTAFAFCPGTVGRIRTDQVSPYMLCPLLCLPTANPSSRNSALHISIG